MNLKAIMSIIKMRKMIHGILRIMKCKSSMTVIHQLYPHFLQVISKVKL